MGVVHIITPEYRPQVGGVADYTRLVACGLADVGEDVHVWGPGTASREDGDRVAVHPEMGTFSRADLERVDRLLEPFPVPRRVIVQWVPHGYGYRAMNVGLCLWLWRRAMNGDRVEIMVHEPYLAFWEGSWSQTAAAAVHRLMTAILVRAASRIWIAIPAWESMWAPYRFGRNVPFAWLPIPCSLPEPDAQQVESIRAQFRDSRAPIVGHLGTYGTLVTALLTGVIPRILRLPGYPQFLLIGCGSHAFRDQLISREPSLAARIASTGSIDDRTLAAHIVACDVMVQPYPDGISSRRTTAMAGLRFGVPIVTTRGYLTEKLWDETRSVKLSAVGDDAALTDNVAALLSSGDARNFLGAAGRALYFEYFDVVRTIDELRTAPSENAA